MSTLTDAERLANVAAHVERLTDLLTTQLPEGATQRIYRARAIMGGDYVVMTLLQDGTKVRVYASVPFRLWGDTTIKRELAGQYAVDEIVAFLALDTVSPETIEWIDETRYPVDVVVGDIIRNTVISG